MASPIGWLPRKIDARLFGGVEDLRSGCSGLDLIGANHGPLVRTILQAAQQSTFFASDQPFGGHPMRSVTKEIIVLAAATEGRP